MDTFKEEMKEARHFANVAKSTIRKRHRGKKPATQRYLPIGEIHNDTVVLKDGGVRAILQVEALNFNLKSENEQKSIIAGYETFVNTLAFPVQIIVRSTKVNIDPYIEHLKERAAQQKNELLKKQTEQYAFFIEKVVEVADIMQKRFYVVIPFDTGAPKTKNTLSTFFDWMKTDDTSSRPSPRHKEFARQYAQLQDRVTIAESALNNIGLVTRRLKTEELISLFYQIYNPETSQEQKLKGIMTTDPLVH